MNAIQAIEEAKPTNPRVTIAVHRTAELAYDDAASIEGFSVTDNGIGFHDLNMDSFNTSFSTYKINQGGKGLGRLTWLKAFDSVKIESRFYDDEEKKLIGRDFEFDINYDPDNVAVRTATSGEPGTTIKLLGFSNPWRDEVPRDIQQLARRICEHFILILMDEGCPSIDIIDGRTRVSVNQVFRDTFDANSRSEQFFIKDQKFFVSSFRIREPRSSRNRIVYCANKRSVITEPLDKYLPNFSGRLTDLDGSSFVYVAVVTGGYLDERVNPARTDFNLSDQDAEDIEDEVSSISLFENEIRRSEIRNATLDFVQRDLSQVISDINETKIIKVKEYIESDAPHYKILYGKIGQFIDRISRDPTRNDIESALHRELHNIEVELKREGSRILSEASKLDDYEEYENRIGEFLNNQNEVGMAALAQYVAHRRIVLNLFQKAISRDQKDEKYPLERVVHHLIFPMRSDTNDTLFSQQNLWILDERLNYHSFVASDKELRSIKEIGSDGSRTRPDLTIFDRPIKLSEGSSPLSSLTIVEFKRPMRNDYKDDENPLLQVAQCVKEIRAGKAMDADGRLIKVLSPDIPAKCYIVSDITPKLREQLEIWNAIQLPGQEGYYGYHPTFRIYFEVLDYDTVLLNAERRNRILFDKLNLLGSRDEP